MTFVDQLLGKPKTFERFVDEAMNTFVDSAKNAHAPINIKTSSELTGEKLAATINGYLFTYHFVIELESRGKVVVYRRGRFETPSAFLEAAYTLSNIKPEYFNSGLPYDEETKKLKRGTGYADAVILAERLRLSGLETTINGEPFKKVRSDLVRAGYLVMVT